MTISCATHKVVGSATIIQDRESEAQRLACHIQKCSNGMAFRYSNYFFVKKKSRVIELSVVSL